MDLEPQKERKDPTSSSSSMPMEQSSEVMSSDKVNSSSSADTSFQFLRGAVDKSVNKLTSKNRIFPHVKEHFEPVYRGDSKNVVELFKSMMDQLKAMITEEIDLQLDANNIQQLLGELDTVKKGGKAGQKGWRPSGNPHEDLKAHLRESSGKEFEHLEKIYRSLLAKNNVLNDSVARSQKYVESTVQQLEKSCNEWEEAASALPDATRQEIVNIALELPCVIKSDEGC